MKIKTTTIFQGYGQPEFQAIKYYPTNGDTPYWLIVDDETGVKIEETDENYDYDELINIAEDQTKDKPLIGHLLSVFMLDDGTFKIDWDTSESVVKDLKEVNKLLKDTLKEWNDAGEKGLFRFISDTFSWKKQ